LWQKPLTTTGDDASMPLQAPVVAPSWGIGGDMEDQEKAIAAQNPDDAAKGRTESSSQSSGRWHSMWWHYITTRLKMFSGLGGPARLFLMIVAAVFGAVILLWIVDKFVFYYLARSYIDEVADVLDLNPHLANALVLLTFVIAVFFAGYVWSFSRQRRLIGILGLSTLVIGHSLILWWGTRDITVDRRGNATKCYVLSRDGKVTYGEHPGIDPATGRECRPVKPEMVERLQKYASGQRPQAITTSNPIFFDPRSGEPIVWYYKSSDNAILIYDLMGFQPDTGEELLPITKEVAEQWKKQGEIRCVPKRVSDPDKYVFFDPLNGQARAWYWVGANGAYEFYDCVGFQPQTGDRLQVVTREVINDWTNKKINPTTPDRVPSRVQITKDTVFFDPVTGNPRLWYWRRDKGDYDFFDGPGFHPQNGQALQSFTKDSLAQYQQEIEEKERQLKAEQERIENEQKEKAEADAKKQLEQQQKKAADEQKRAEELQRATEAARRCDELAANPNDAHRVGEGVPYAALKPQAAEAVQFCDLAAKQNPNELRFQYQLGRALELAGDGSAHVTNRQKALEIHQALAKAGYAASFDNLASLYRWDRKDLATAVVLFRKGVELGDSDSMLSLADLIENGQVTPENPNETPLELYKRAAGLGNQNGVRAYQAELTNAQQVQQQQIQRLQQQQMMLQIMGNVLRNIH
jgi:tetratricopeptide (TPR) repeat protein